MLFQSFSIYDSKGEMYSPPFFMVTKGLAIRRFSETAIDRQTSIGLHPQDFTLFYIGEFDDQTGAMIPNRTPEPLIKASETIEGGLAPQGKNGPAEPQFPSPPFTPDTLPNPISDVRKY